MRFSVILCSLVCSTSFALSIKRDESAAVAPLEPRTAEPVVHVVRQEITKVQSKAIAAAAAASSKAAAKASEAAAKASSKAAAVASKASVEASKLAAKASKTNVAVTPTYVAGCEAAARRDQGANCGVYGTISSPHDPYVINDTPFDSCSNACLCGLSRFDCKSFAWTALAGNSAFGNCTLYDQTLEKMGYSGGSALLYDRKCFHRASATSSMPIQTMGALETKVRRRAQVDDYVVGALMGM